MDMMDHYGVGHGYSSSQQDFLTLVPPLSPVSPSTTTPMQTCTVQRTCTFACIHLPATSAWTNIQARKLSFLTPILITPLTSTHAYTHRQEHTCKEIFLPCFSQASCSVTFPHTHTHSHTFTHTRTHTHTKHTQHFQETQHIHPAGDYMDKEVRIHLIRGTGALEG